MVSQAIKPDYSLSSHVAALGLTFTNGSAMPDEYANGAFIGEHGSWNRNTFNGYKVVYVPFENGKPAGMAQDVVTGFLDGDQARGRPVGVAMDGTGALLIADDAGNTVWRVAAADGSVTPEPVGSDQIAAGTTGGSAPTDAAALPTADAPGGQEGATAPTDAAQATGTAGAATVEPSPPPAAVQPASEGSPAGEAATAEAPATPEPPQTDVAPAVLPEGTVEDGPAPEKQ
jgi:hypothetical protein